MKKTRILSLALLLALLLNCFSLTALAEPDDTSSTVSEPTESASSAVTGITPPPALLDYAVDDTYYVRAKASALIDLDAGALLYGGNIDAQIYPASLTKIMTCMIALERGNLDDILTVSESSQQDLVIGGSTANLKVGEQISLRELLYCVMVSSANEACNVVAEYISGSISGFVALMNEYAAALGMTSTHYANTHGLHSDEHYTTVRDLSTLVRWAWQHELFREFSTVTKHVVPATNLSEERELHTTNYLTSGLVVGKYYYEKAAGIKTGFTSKAGGCLISTAQDGDKHLLSIVVGCDTIENDDGTTTDERFTETKKLLEYGLNHFSLVQVLGAQDSALLYAKTDADCAPGAGVDMTQILMGRGDLYSDNDTELVGDGSHYSAQIGYLGRGSQTIDVNVVVNHYGKNTECEIDTSGALKDAAKKVFRGTIDFKTGSSNSVGNEKETVLMLGDDVINKTVPLILCAEENVVGNHGATIGELDDETLFYFESRGISRAQAENILARASIERFARTVDDEALRAQILQTLEEELNDDE